jgi:pimeloyl-ACP methyl ester carboxylesterase
MVQGKLRSGAVTSTHELEVIERQPATDSGKPPLVFVHGLGHGAWCWENWQQAAAEAGYPSYAVSLRGHGGSGGPLRRSLLAHYVDDVVRTASALPQPAVLVGHSMGGLVVQQALAQYAAHAGVLVAPVPRHPALAALLNVARRHPQDALKILVGGSLPLRTDYLFNELPEEEARRYTDRCGGESPLVQFQLILHRPPRKPLGGAPVLMLATPDDHLVPVDGQRATARRLGARVEEFPGMGHDLMLETRWREPLKVLLDWLPTAR